MLPSCNCNSITTPKYLLTFLFVNTVNRFPLLILRSFFSSLLIMSAREQLTFRGTLEGHSGWVTSIATTLEASTMIVSGSRDKKVMVWELTPEGEQYGYPRRFKPMRLFIH